MLYGCALLSRLTDLSSAFHWLSAGRPPGHDRAIKAYPLGRIPSGGRGRLDTMSALSSLLRGLFIVPVEQY
ncbi:hypothetical protein FB451DRAFT_1273311 [Mycena latifolia]|nr:hypothetical protein FB451DRAFT_1273311 [Mycena latifolia]